LADYKKIVLIGAGSLQFGLGCVGNILKSDILKGYTITLHDINPENLELTYNACKSAINERNLNFVIEQTIDRKEALKNASFIVNSIEIPPRFKLLDFDYRIPQQFGCMQISGENAGPGGLFHSLRVIPPILDICKDVNKICPNAVFINFSNPMNRICLAIYRKFPNLKFVGLCHEYYHFIPLLEEILSTKETELEIIAGGLNHFGVLLDVKYKDKNQDAYPDIRKNGPEFLNSVKSYDGFKFIAFFLETYGYLPYTADSHYGEYIHWSWRKADITAVRKFWSSYEKLLKISQKKIKRKIKQGKGSSLVNPDNERAIPIIEGIISDANYIEASVNIPNNNIFSNLPKDLTVEAPALINKEGINPIRLGDYPIELTTLIKEQAAIQDLLLEGIFRQSKDLLFQALLADPVVDSPWQARKILEELLRIEKNYIQIDLS